MKTKMMIQTPEDFTIFSDIISRLTLILVAHNFNIDEIDNAFDVIAKVMQDTDYDKPKIKKMLSTLKKGVLVMNKEFKKGD